jgi:hypothetical protein
MRKNGLCEWVHQRKLKQPSERRLILAFERKFPRSKDKECESVSSYPHVAVEDEVGESDGEPNSPDSIHYDAPWELDLQEYFRDVYFFEPSS